jgi:uncharacterized OsmC-like protein
MPGERSTGQQEAAGQFTITLDLDHDYQFDADLELPGVAPLRVDEPPPIGQGNGPSPTRMLAASVGQCLASSALFCLRKARIDVQSMSATVVGEMVRNESGKLRMGRLTVELRPVVQGADVPRMHRCLEIFEDFCVVTGAVREGLPVDVTIKPSAVT